MGARFLADNASNLDSVEPKLLRQSKAKTEVLDVASESQLAKILRSVDQGDEVILTRDGRKIVGVKPVKGSAIEKPKERAFGLSARAVTYVADDFDAELPDSFWLKED